MRGGDRMTFWSTIILDFFVAFGVVIGGSIMGGVGALIGHYNVTPMETIEELAGQLKIWALVAALGGTFDMLRSVETHIFEGHLSLVAQQFLMLLSAFAGAHIGYLLITWLIRGEIL